MHYVTIQPSKVDQIALGTMILVNVHLHCFRIASKQVAFLANSCLKENFLKMNLFANLTAVVVKQYTR